MFAIIGIVVVFGAIVGGYLMEHGNLLVLLQPAELIIIGGAALGTMLIAKPLPIVIKILKRVRERIPPEPVFQSFLPHAPQDVERTISLRAQERRREAGGRY
jgi:flagellar motor component MotA